MKLKSVLISFVLLSQCFGLELVRQKNVATIITFPIVDVDNLAIVSAAGLDSDIDTWTDGAAPDGYTPCTNEATETDAGVTGWYYLSLTQAEMNNDYILINVYSSTADTVDQRILIRTMVGDPLNVATSDDGGTINVTGGAVDTVTTTTTATTATNLTNAASNGDFTATMKASINTEVDNSMQTYNLDHLALTATVAADMTAEVADDTILSRILANGDTSAFVPSTDGLQPIRDQGDAAWTTGGGSGLTYLASGTAQSGTASTIVLAGASTFANDELNGNVINIHTGTGVGQSRVIISNTLGDDTCNVSPNWATNPDATSQYEIVQGSTNIVAISLDVQSLTDLKDFADAGYTPGTNSVLLVDTASTVTDGAKSANQLTDATWTDTRAGYIDELAAANLPTDIDAILLDTGTTLDGIVDAILVDTAAYDTDADYATAVWEGLLTGYGGAGSYGEKVESLSAGGDATEDKQDTIIGYIDTEVADILTDTGTTLDDLVDDLETRVSFIIPGDSTAVAADVIEYEGVDGVDGEIQSEVSDALVALQLDHLLGVDTTVAADADLSTYVVTGSVMAHVMAAGADVTTAYNASTDSLEAIRVEGDASWSSGASNPNVLLASEIATVTTQTSFTLADGGTVDDSYNDQTIVLYDDTNSDYPSVRTITDYVGATKTITIDSGADFTLADDDSVRIFATAPGSTAPTAAVVADAVWDELSTGHTTAGYAGAQLWTDIDALLVEMAEQDANDILLFTAIAAGGSGNGATTLTYTLTDDVSGDPIADVLVWVTTDIGGTNTVASLRTNNFGIAVFTLDDGTYYMWRKKGGYDFTNPQSQVVN